MSNNLDKSLPRFKSGPDANCNSQCDGREGNPTGSPSELTNGDQVKIIAKLLLLQNEPIIRMKTKGSKKAHPNRKGLPSGEIFK
jgi:hypothetical protein